MKNEKSCKEAANGAIQDFIERDSTKQIEMEEMLRDSKLEDVMSPIYFVQNVNATIVGW